VFRFTPGVSGVTTLHAFVGSDGAGPNTTLVKALDGSLYGTTSSGGAHNLGTVFRISEGGDFESLHSFDSASGEGTSPVGLAAGSDGNLYGTTSSAVPTTWVPSSASGRTAASRRCFRSRS
jgi:uncharacterized repeat protein (TIGR03803 family)